MPSALKTAAAQILKNAPKKQEEMYDFELAN